MRPPTESARRGRRHEIVDFFRAGNRPLSARDVAAETGLHINTARFHLDNLVRAGILRREDGRTNGPGRPPTRYTLVPGMADGGLRNYKLLAEVLLSHLATDAEPAGAAVRAGEAWGRYLIRLPAPGQRLSAEDSVERLTDLLADIGFDPRVAARLDEAMSVELRHCPFLELAHTHRELVCGLHLGLMRGALEQLDAPLRVQSLTPFADPHTCVAHVVPASSNGTKD
jgi:predicted ArsR family transcriptional regulator